MFDPEGRKSPKGEFQPERQQVGPVAVAATGQRDEAASAGAKRQLVVERKAERAAEAADLRCEVAGQER